MIQILMLAAVCVLISAAAFSEEKITLNKKDSGYRGIWYMNQPSGDQYVYKYSGGLGTYCAKHRPFAVYCPEVRKTFFCYGGTEEGSWNRPEIGKAGNDRKDLPGFLLHEVGFFDHTTGEVCRPTILLDKRTIDAHDNPVISVDHSGYIWIFSTSHGRMRPSCVHRSRKPYDIEAFDLIQPVRREGGKREAITNFSYMQPWHCPGKGFIAFFTKYNYPATRTSCFMTSGNGTDWSGWKRLAAIGEGHYQISAVCSRGAGTAFNYHPREKGLNWRTNLYYIQTGDMGRSWQNVRGESVRAPLKKAKNRALVHDYASEGLNVYVKDICYDARNHPVILYVTSRGYEAGPKNDPRTWTTARWTGAGWDINPVCTSDSNYDTGSLYIESRSVWKVIGPVETGPQPGNPGGEVVLWESRDRGRTWKKVRQLTEKSERNHNYVRRPVNAHPDFYAFWADGHGRKPSRSVLYFSDSTGNVYRLPETMKKERMKPEPLNQ